jgi:glycosyltransferase involved in cell wall biosynthesis
MKHYPGIVHVGNYLSLGCDGAAASLHAQVNALHSLGANVSVWQFEVGISDVSSVFCENGLNVHRLPRFRNPLLAALTVPSTSRRWLATQLRQTDVIHLHSVFSPQNNFVSKLGVSYAITPQGGWSESVLHGRRAVAKAVWVSLFEKKLWAKAAFVQAVSLAEMRGLKSLPEVGRLEFIPNGVDLPCAEISQPKCTPYFLFIGRLAIQQKGLDLLVQAYSDAYKREYSIPDLLIAGPDHRGGSDYLEGLIGGLGLNHKVRLLGPVFGKEKSELLAGAYVFVHPSRWEGMPLSVLEALAHGTPCLATEATGLAEWMEARGCGWSVGADSSELAEALLHVYSAQREVREKSHNAHSSVASDYSWSGIAERLSILYSDVARQAK